MAEPLWDQAALLAATGGRWSGPDVPGFTGVSIDSRSLEPGEIFVAIKGERHDGHDFVPQALASGAGVAIVSETYDGSTEGPLLYVADPLTALNQLAEAARHRSEAKVVAVTGSAGKTGTKEALRLALAPSGSVHVSEKSYNNHWGVPLSLARLPGSTRYGVFEIGMNHAGEIRPLTAMVRPHLAIITTVGGAHLGHFTSESDIARAKAEIFTGVQPGGAVLLNRDNPHFALLAELAQAEGVEIVTFGEHAAADIRLLAYSPEEEGGRMEVQLFGQTVTCSLGMAGRHHAQNALAVLGAAHWLSADLAKATEALALWRPGEGRGRRHLVSLPQGEILIIDEAYNANPLSMAAAIETLGMVPRARFGRRIAVLGDMLELGDKAVEHHAGLAPTLEKAGVDRVFLGGEHMKVLHEALPTAMRGGWAETPGGVLAKLLPDLRAGDVVLVKASLGSGFLPLVTELLNALRRQGVLSQEATLTTSATEDKNRAGRRI